MRYPQTFPPSVSPTPCQCNRTIPYQVRRYPAARNLIRGRPSISVRQQTGNRNEWPLSGRLTLPGNGEDGRKPDRSVLYAILRHSPPTCWKAFTSAGDCAQISCTGFVKRRRSNSHERVMKGSTERQRKSPPKLRYRRRLPPTPTQWFRGASRSRRTPRG